MGDGETYYVARTDERGRHLFAVDTWGVDRLLAPTLGSWADDDVVAHAILQDALCETPAPDDVSRFRAEVLSIVPEDGFVMRLGLVTGWGEVRS